MTRFSLVRFLTLILLVAPVWAQKSPSLYRVLMPGTFFEDSGPAAPGKGWLALSTVNGQWQLQATTVRAKRVLHPMSYSSNPSEPDALEITSSVTNALLLLKIPGLISGKLQSVALTKPDPKSDAFYDGIDPKGKPIALKLSGQNYLLRADKTGYLRISSGEQDSPLGGSRINSKSADSESKTSADLVWAGDLNQDGGLDVIVRWSSLYSYSVCVFLSTGASAQWRLGKPYCFDSSI